MGVCGILGVDKEHIVTADELEKLISMFASQKTCEEREKTIIAAMDRFTHSIETMTTTVKSLNDMQIQQDSRLKILEEYKDSQNKRYNLKIAVAMLFVAILSQINNIIKWLK